MTESPPKATTETGASNVTAGEVDLSNCDRELVHLCGAIQPHAALLVLQEPELTILQASGNTQDILGVATEALLGQSVETVLGRDPTAALRERIRRDDLNDALPHVLSVPRLCGKETAFHVFGHRTAGALLLEFEPAAPADLARSAEIHSDVRAVLNRLQKTPSLQSFLSLAVDEIRALTGFDRVMAYRFSADGSGQVVAESLEPGLDPYLGLHYPASDIPEPARRLFLLNWVRHLPDVDYVPVPLVPELNPQTGSPTDLSYVSSRSVSVMYTGYLRNMGVQSTLVMTLLSAGKLWGLISCMHHRSPKAVSYEIRLASEFFAHMVSLLLSEKETIDHQAYRARLNGVTEALLAAIRKAATVQDALAGTEPNMLSVIDAAGAAVVTEEGVRLLGQTPAEASVRALAEWLAQRGESRYATHALTDEFPEAAAFGSCCAGLLAIRLSHVAAEYLMWFRPATVEEVNWAGDPRKPVEISETDGEFRLQPRTSFALWKQTVSGRARPWLTCEVDHASQLRSAIVEVIGERARTLARINEELEKSNLELDSFAYAASHDLKEPLRGISNFARFLQDSEPGLTEEGRQRIETIVRLTKRMHDLLESLLHYSRVGRSELDLQATAIDELIVQVVAMLRSGNRSALDVDVRVQGPLPTVLCDRIRVTELLHNLIGNAIKYNDKSAKWVEIGCDQALHPPVFFVRDNGIGIPEQHWQRIFELFRRLHGRDAYGGGTGVGLTIAKKVVTRHGGQIWLESKPGEGTTIYFTLEAPADDEPVDGGAVPLGRRAPEGGKA